jgi:hypothetical protein
MASYDSRGGHRQTRLKGLKLGRAGEILAEYEQIKKRRRTFGYFLCMKMQSNNPRHQEPRVAMIFPGILSSRHGDTAPHSLLEFSVVMLPLA